MDMNTYLAETLKVQTRIALALETIAKNGGTLTHLQADAGNASPVTAAIIASTAGAPAATAPAPAQAAAASAATAEAGNASASTATPASAQPAAGGSEAAGKAPKLTVDDLRNGLRAYAAKEGNPAAMALLERFGAKAVSGVPADKWAEFVGACK
jgi:hypothetical protein